MARYLLDENVNQSRRIQEQCEECGIDVVRVHDLDLLHTDDRIIFEVAHEQDYVIVTGNIYEFRAFQQELSEAGELMAGAIYIPPDLQKNTELIIRRIIEVEVDEYYYGGEWWVQT